MNLEELQSHIDKIIYQQNNHGIPDFEGYSPYEMNYKLLRLILLTFAKKFNWAYYDGFGENQIGQLGWGFSLILLSKYGNEKRLDSFYVEKYFKAYPNLLETIEPDYGTLERYSTSFYSIRTFDRFLDYFGLIKIDKEGSGLVTKNYFTKTDLFDKLINISPTK